MDRATAALSRDDFPVAEGELAWLASRCDTGDRGRTALLLLAAAELDPANPNGDVDDAAYLSASYLQLPSLPEDDAQLARTLYRLALDRGGRPVDDLPLPSRDEGAAADAGPGSPAGDSADDSGTTGTSAGANAAGSTDSTARAEPSAAVERSATRTAAARLEGCDGPGAAANWRSLPRPLDSSSAERIDALEQSLELRADSVGGLRAALASSRKRVADLEAEIERIRELLTEPVPPPRPPGGRR
jgi:hypothetical protein